MDDVHWKLPQLFYFREMECWVIGTPVGVLHWVNVLEQRLDIGPLCSHSQDHAGLLNACVVQCIGSIPHDVIQYRERLLETVFQGMFFGTRGH
jgi:hypothetical protein